MWGNHGKPNMVMGSLARIIVAMLALYKTFPKQLGACGRSRWHLSCGLSW